MIELTKSAKVTFRVVTSNSKPLVNALVVASCIWADQMGQTGMEMTKRTDTKGQVLFELPDGEWVFDVIEGVPATEEYYSKQLKLNHGRKARHHVTLKGHKAATIKGRVILEGCTAEEQRRFFKHAAKMRTAVIVIERASETNDEIIGNYAELATDGSYCCKLANAKQLDIDLEVFFPGETHRWIFPLGYRIKKGQKSVSLPTVTLQKIDPSVTSISGRITLKEHALYAVAVKGDLPGNRLMFAETFCNEKGSFKFSSLPSGDYRLDVIEIGASSTAVPVTTLLFTLDANQVTEVKIDASSVRR